MDERIAILVDIVGSRRVPDRQAAQAAVERVLGRIHELRPFAEPARATRGDELQAVSPDLAHALWATGVARLRLFDDPGVRFGLGAGEFAPVDTVGGPVPDGSAWWNARSAIEHAHELERGRSTSFVRCGYEGPGASGVRSFLLLRDDAISRMTVEERSLAAGRLEGRTQEELAEEAGVTQSAVSQRLASSGGRALELADREASA